MRSAMVWICWSSEPPALATRLHIAIISFEKTLSDKPSVYGGISSKQAADKPNCIVGAVTYIDEHDISITKSRLIDCCRFWGIGDHSWKWPNIDGKLCELSVLHSQS